MEAGSATAGKREERKAQNRAKLLGAARKVFADKGLGYGIPSITIDGTDPEAIAGAFAWAAERARDGKGPALIELVAMRMCGHAHHDDMLVAAELGFARARAVIDPGAE